MERALNNVCRGCSTPVAVGNVPRYDVAAQCRATAGLGRDENSCRRDEEEAGGRFGIGSSRSMSALRREADGRSVQ